MSSPAKRPRSPSKPSVDELRKQSRRNYLARRETQQLSQLRDEIIDEKTLFRDEELTERERRDLQLKQQIYELATERAASSNVAPTYVVPDQKGVQDDSIDVTSLDAHPASDQKIWEDSQIRKGKLHTQQTAHSSKYPILFDALDFDLPAKLQGLPHLPQRSFAQQRIAKRKEERERIQEERRSLPMYAHRDALIKAIKQYQVVIVQSETGSGKTTQIPQYLIEEGFGSVVCTQPRRVAAMSVAARVAYEMGVKLGNEVGYSIRFEDCTSDQTVIKYVTDGMLLREFLSEPDLKAYDVILIDEAHERSMSTDIVMGLIKDISRFRGDDVRVIISSATMDTEKFSSYFDDAPIYSVPGRRYDVDIYYTKTPEPDYVEASCVSVLQIHASQPAGDILVFLTGQEEIEAAEEILRERTRGLGSKLGELIIAPIYATLPSEMQAKIFEPTPEGARKVVLATNIAETSVTIPGIVYVIDPGFCKQKSYNAKTGMESLLVVPVSRAGAKQRAGRAGRTQPGKCFRLYTKWSYMNEMEEDTVPELLRTNLSQVVLLLLSLGIDNLIDFDFIDAPPPEALLRSLEHLYALGALNDKGKLTKLGRRMAELPLEPMMAKALLASEKYKCSEEVTVICSMLSVNNAVFYRPKQKKMMADAARAAFARGGGGDHMTLLRCYAQWRDAGFSTQWCYEHFVQTRTMKRARDVYEQLDALLERVEIDRHSVGTGDKVPILKALTAGFFYNACRLQKNGHYRTLKNPHTVRIHPSSCFANAEIRPRWLIYHELVFTTKEFMRQVFEIEGNWLHEAAPHFHKAEDVLEESKRKMPKVLGKAGGKVR
ncbi:Pre-mRNA-splicing factor ATP-dependent RNA helicase DEAH1 [Gracilariopsis chorda]|uniref:RNA helicase n=1 Tax=Gracilariopsis chorda TaxID=448386 RepID=A0A2V3IG57_9FLOR|nr:Pre-mRNA-splicing factor ATP-dependent RNA helicase DEAH1 [Gracilariopsis chorda]|eukprot:PXF41069.1 Pre-mRNA-splicing factor ATP-dependent RNA helicase DEAH1 [Gracilariopsis chorda]